MSIWIEMFFIKKRKKNEVIYNKRQKRRAVGLNSPAIISASIHKYFFLSTPETTLKEKKKKKQLWTYSSSRYKKKKRKIIQCSVPGNQVNTVSRFLLFCVVWDPPSSIALVRISEAGGIPNAVPINVAAQYPHSLQRVNHHLPLVLA